MKKARQFAFLFLIGLSTSLFGQLSFPLDFTPHGPGGGGYMYSPSISPHDPNLIFLSCDMGGLYRSANGGQSWQMQQNQAFVSTVKGKVQFSNDPNVMYVCKRSTTNPNDPLFRGELAKSTDGGFTWQAMADPTGSGVHRLEVDPGSAQRMLLNEYDRLFFSNDAGASWTEVYHPADDQMWLGGVFWDGNDIYVGTDKGLLVSHDGGQSFNPETHTGFPAGSGILHLSGAKAGGTVRLFAIAATASELYAWVEPLDLRNHISGFYRMNYSANASWTNARGNVPLGIKIAWVDLALNNIQTVWAAGEDNGLPMVFKSTNGGQSWINTFLAVDNQNVSTGWGGDYGAFSYLWSGAALGFEVSNSDPNHLIMSDGFGHVTTDGGLSWTATYVHPDFQNPAGSPTLVDKFYQSSGLDVTTAHQLFWLNDSSMYSANTDIGLTYSADAGETWSFARNTFYPWGTLANPNWYRMVQRPDNQHVYAALSEVNDMYLGYRITDNQVAGTGLVVRSMDQGRTWDTIFNFGRPVVWIELDASNPNRMFASVVHPNTGGIYRSNNSGATWVKLNLPSRTAGHPYNIVSLKDGGLVVTFSARALADGETLTESSGVFYSPDGGNTWLDRTADAMKFYTKDLVLDPHDPNQNTWYTTVWGRFTVFQGPNNAGNGGVYKTTDRGLNWTRIWANESAESLTIHPDKPGTAYITAENDGLFFTGNLGADQPIIERINTFSWWRPKRVFFKPNASTEVWVTTMGGGLWKGISNPDGVINYSPSTEDFANPERGFMQFTETNSSNYEPLDAANMATWRDLNQPFGADYAIYSTLGYRGFYLEDFKNGPISNAYLQAMQQDFDAAREAGVKLVLRFAYTRKSTPPYGDAPKSIVLQHIAQLKPLFQANADVIASLNMGFIGAWGEGYYTDYFGDDSQPPYGLTTQNWNDRNEVLTALLDAMPSDRMVQVRVPQMKQKAVYGAAAPSSSAPLTPAEAWQNTAKARIGFHNDCFLSGDDDQGTFKNYDTGISGSDTAAFKPYMSVDSRYVPVGGETCIDWNPYSDCNGPNGGLAQHEMRRMHYSYLNAGWNNEVNNDWVSGGCMEEIKQGLGYRLELVKGIFPTEARPGQSISIQIDLKNVGFAAPFNPRLLQLLLRNTASNAIWRVDLPEDARSWLPGGQVFTLSHTFCLPLELPTGAYELLFHLADPYPALSNRKEYAIRLANQNTWEASTGFNRLLHQITVNNTALSLSCAGETCFQPEDQLAPSVHFTASGTTGCAPYLVTFSNQTAACWNYAWTFPGGVPTTSQDPEPEVLYLNSGAYDVGLTVSNNAGTASETSSEYITILPLVTAGFSYATNGFSASFSNTSTNATSFAWDFGDGTAISTEANPVHTFSAAGNYIVVLTVSNACGQKTFQQVVTVECALDAITLSTSGGTGICPGATNTLYATPGYAQYAWQRNGVPLGVFMDSLVVDISGLYLVYATDSLGCTHGSNSVLITETPAPIPLFSVLVNGYTATFTNSSSHASAYSWDFGDGSPLSTAANPQHAYAAPGIYQVTLFASNVACGTVSFSLSVTVECLPPTVEIASNGGTQLCEGQSVVLEVTNALFTQYRWYHDGNEIPGANLSNLIVLQTGVYKVLCTDGLGCSNFSNEIPVQVWTLPSATIQPPGPINLSFGESIQLDAGTGLFTWLWSTGELTHQISVDDCGAYSLTVMDMNGCTNTAGPVEVIVSPQVTFSNDTLFSSPASSYQWLFNGVPIPGATDQTLVPLESGDYSVQATCLTPGDVSSNVVPVVITGISVLNSGQVIMYPNPLTEENSLLTISAQGLDIHDYTLVLTDLSGRALRKKVVSSHQTITSLETAGLPAGGYLIQIQQPGIKRIVGRVVKL